MSEGKKERRFPVGTWVRGAGVASGRLIEGAFAGPGPEYGLNEDVLVVQEYGPDDRLLGLRVLHADTVWPVSRG